MDPLIKLHTLIEFLLCTFRGFLVIENKILVHGNGGTSIK